LCTFWNTPAWTLSCETVFYFLFPLLVAIKWPRQTRKLLLILAGCWIASLVIPAVYMWMRPDGLGPITRMSNSYWLRAVKMTPLPHLPTFTAGIVLSKLNDRLQLPNRARYWLAIIGLGSVCAVLMQGQKMPFLLMHNGLLTPLFAISILGLTGHHPITRFLRLPLFVAVGEASYCLYILHFNLWRSIHDSGWLVRLHIARFDPWVSYLVLELSALLAYRFIERPTRNWLHQVLPALKHARGQFPAARVPSPQVISAEQASEG
jgi:peptidoglycan/LPS O-acetylase OafA/YrhL